MGAVTMQSRTLERSTVPEHPGSHRRNPASRRDCRHWLQRRARRRGPDSRTAPEHRLFRKAVRGSRRTRIPSRRSLELRSLERRCFERRSDELDSVELHCLTFRD